MDRDSEVPGPQRTKRCGPLLCTQTRIESVIVVRMRNALALTCDSTLTLNGGAGSLSATTGSLAIRTLTASQPITWNGPSAGSLGITLSDINAISIGLPRRPTGWQLRTYLRTPGARKIRSAIGVSVNPGHTALIRIPLFAFSRAAQRSASSTGRS